MKCIWTEEIRIDPTRCTRMGEQSNFWSMGETGPCGPCSEIFLLITAPTVTWRPPVRPDGGGVTGTWRSGISSSCSTIGRRTAYWCRFPSPRSTPGWVSSALRPSCRGVHSNYDIDLFKALIREAAEITGTQEASDSPSLRVIADHIRACTFLIIDGVVPSNEGRGYVLRHRIIDVRAIRHGYLRKLRPDPALFLPARADPGARNGRTTTCGARAGEERAPPNCLAQEESRFAETLTTGMALLDAETAKLTSPVIPGETVFRLYDTYGFPVDLTADVARERGYTIDQQGFDAAMAAQRDRGRSASKFGVALKDSVKLSGKTGFSGYDRLAGAGRITALIFDGAVVDTLSVGQEGQVVLDETPFYAEGGGQMGDSGTLGGASARFAVRDTQKIGASFAHIGVVESGTLRVGDELQACVDGERRAAIALNHSATHLLHAALRAVLGKHVQQKGSLVAPDRLRFDFSPYPVPRSSRARSAQDRGDGEQGHSPQ